MRQVYVLVLLLSSALLSAASYRGFLETKDGVQLTGYLNVLQYSPGGNIITFTNDFGDEYVIHPFLVSGFGFNYEGEAMRFVSRQHEGLWYFLQEDTRGRALSLYRLPDGKSGWVDDRMLSLFRTPPPQFYIEFGEREFLAVPRSGYKRNLREFFALSYPLLAEKIGTRGYRYKDLPAIVREFNDTGARKRRSRL